jgi:translation initiation factor 1 (eIF-1/SUI1)
MEKIVLKKEELKGIQDVQQQQNNLLFQLGQIEYQQKTLESQKVTTLNALTTSEQDANKVAKELEEKYGEGTLNIENGEFIKS